MAWRDVKRPYAQGRVLPRLLFLLVSCAGHVTNLPSRSLPDLREVTPSQAGPGAASSEGKDVPSWSYDSSLGQIRLEGALPDHVTAVAEVPPRVGAVRAPSEVAPARARAVETGAVSSGTMQLEIGSRPAAEVASPGAAVANVAAASEPWGLVQPEQNRLAEAVASVSASIGRVTSVPTQKSAAGIVSGVVAPTFGSFGQGSSWVVTTSSTLAPSLIRRADRGRQATHMLEERARKAATADASAAVAADGSVDARGAKPPLSSRLQGAAHDPAWETIPMTDDPSSPVVARRPNRWPVPSQEEPSRSARDHLPSLGFLLSVAARGDAQALGVFLILLCMASRSGSGLSVVEKRMPDKVAAFGHFLASPAAAKSLLARAASRDYGAVGVWNTHSQEAPKSSLGSRNAGVHRGAAAAPSAAAAAAAAAPSAAASGFQEASEEAVESSVDEVVLLQREVASLEREVASLSVRLTQGKGSRPEAAPHSQSESQSQKQKQIEEASAEGSPSSVSAMVPSILQSGADWTDAEVKRRALEALRWRLQHLEKEKVSLRRWLSFAGTWSSVGSSSSRFVVS